MNSAIYKNFKPYSYYKNPTSLPEKKTKSYLPLLGSSLGAGLSYAYYANKYKGLSEKDIGALKTGFKMIVMCASSIIGGVALGSINKTGDEIKKKVKEGAFQMMNMAIPMTFVTLFHHFCEKIKSLNKTPIKILGSIAAMVSGAALATIITNATKDENQPKRKYTIKDATANFDDVVATIAIGFPEVAKKVPVNQIVPFIYAYNGARAGMKE
ncbi:hypothetical protein IJ670_02675 [bacterium]|nr:hypothetical protein [bacterium]